MRSLVTLERTTFRTSRLLEFCSRKELVAQTGHEPEEWPLVLLKELIDNALDACEEAGVAPEITVQVEPDMITVIDNGPGLPPQTVTDMLDFSSRVSSREAYVAPDRGAQGNALKTILAMPFVLDGTLGRVEIHARGLRHQLEFTVDALRQAPQIDHRQERGRCKKRHLHHRAVAGISWLNAGRGRAAVFTICRRLHLAQPASRAHHHLVRRALLVPATDPSWCKWRPSDPTCPHWYTPQHLERLIAAYLTHDDGRVRERTVREFVSEFRGLSGSQKQKAVLEAAGLQRAPLSDLCDGGAIDRGCRNAPAWRNGRSFSAGQARSARHHRQGPPAHRLEAAGCEMASFQYKRVKGVELGLPWLIEAAFAWCPEQTGRRLVTGVNWSPGIINPFRALGPFRQSLDTVLSQQRADRDEPVMVLLHLACPRVEYTDRGKSAVVVAR